MGDLRYALRLLRRNPGYAAVSILTMALGIGATTTLFSVTYGVLLKPLPWADADRIMRVVETRDGHPARLPETMTNATYFSWRDEMATIDAIGGYAIGTNSMTASRDGGDEPIRLRVTAMTPSAFDVLRARPLRGRLFTDAEVPAAGLSGVDTPRPAVISHALWRDWFAGRDDALGTVIRLDDVPHTIVGVMAASFAFPDAETRAWTPLPIPQVVQPRNARSTMIFGGLVRLRPGVSPLRAAAEGTSRARHAPDLGFGALAMFGSSAPPDIAVTPLAQAMTADVRPALLLLLAAVILLLATAVANVGGLQLARASTRRREIAVRTAIGASRRQLLRQLVAESAVVTAAGAAAGVVAAFGLARLLPSVLPADFPRTTDISVSAPVLAVAVLLSIAASVGASLLPATLTRRVEVTAILADESAASAAGARSRSGRLRALVMAAQVAVASLLLVGAALLGRSFVALIHADRGYDPSNLLTARLDLPQRTDGPTHARLADAVIERLRGIPGVTMAAAGNALPFMSLGSALGTELPSPSNPAIRLQVHANVRLVSPGYISAMRLPLLQGRLLNDSDGAASAAAVVSRSFAQQYLGDDPIGKHIPMAVAAGGREDWEVVGVVGDMRQASATDPRSPDVFVSYRQSNGWIRGSIYFVVRTAADPTAQIAALRTAVREQDPTLALDSIMTMEDRVATSLAKPRLYAILLIGFAVAALAIAGVGLFGVLSYAVAQRAREIGIRTALGAQFADVVVLVLRQAVAVTAAGSAAGMWAAFALTRYVSSFLYGVGRADLVSYASVGAVIAAVAAIACIVPARRATRIDPLIALRTQ
ncbi:MAG TPA: ADOP family duplicated permease [Vicinamibacterales bacterium]|nr:ADOP family duplicated permease [Vicinamibacterales bacterium]